MPVMMNNTVAAAQRRDGAMGKPSSQVTGAFCRGADIPAAFIATPTRG